MKSQPYHALPAPDKEKARASLPVGDETTYLSHERTAGICSGCLVRMERKTGSATSLFIALNAAIFFYGFLNPQQELLLSRQFWLSAQDVISGEPWRILTATFLHAGALHVGMNMISLWQLGSLAEPLFGTRRFVLLYLLAGILGFGLSGVEKALTFTSLRELVPSVGASGAVFGIAGALLGVIYARSRTSNEFMGNPFVRQIGLNLALLFVLGLGMPIDHYAHVGGLLSGAALGVLFQTQGKRRGWAPPSDQGQKRRTAILALVILGAATVYSIFPVGSPLWKQREAVALQREKASQPKPAYFANLAEAAKAHDEGRWTVALYQSERVLAQHTTLDQDRALGMYIRVRALVELSRPEALAASQELETVLRDNPKLTEIVGLADAQRLRETAEANRPAQP